MLRLKPLAIVCSCALLFAALYSAPGCSFRGENFPRTFAGFWLIDTISAETPALNYRRPPEEKKLFFAPSKYGGLQVPCVFGARHFSPECSQPARWQLLPDPEPGGARRVELTTNYRLFSGTYNLNIDTTASPDVLTLTKPGFYMRARRASFIGEE